MTTFFELLSQVFGLSIVEPVWPSGKIQLFFVFGLLTDDRFLSLNHLYVQVYQETLPKFSVLIHSLLDLTKTKIYIKLLLSR